MDSLIEIQHKETTRKIINTNAISFVEQAKLSNGSTITYTSKSNAYSLEEMVSEPYENFKKIPGFFEIILYKGGKRIINSKNIARIDPNQPNSNKRTVIHMLSPDMRYTDELEVNEGYDELKQKIGL